MIESIEATSAGLAAGIAWAVWTGAGDAAGVGVGAWALVVIVRIIVMEISESKRTLIPTRAFRLSIEKISATDLNSTRLKHECAQTGNTVVSSQDIKRKGEKWKGGKGKGAK